jgi:outer membrane protein assembly factor BamB
MSARIVLPLLLLLTSTAARTQDWPQFRGPTGQGHSVEQELPLAWSEDTNIRWKVPVPGRGWSSPVIADGRIWLTTSVADDDAASLRVLAFDFETGRELVNAEVFRLTDNRLLNLKNSHASPTPIIDGDRVYVHYGAEGTAALTTSGEILWTTRFPYITQHGNGGSPALYQDLLIINIDGYDQSFAVAVDTGTGEVRWKTPRQEPFSQAYSTPLVIHSDGLDQVITVGAFQTVSLEPESGKEIWRVTYTDGFSNVPRPVYRDRLVYIVTGFQQPSLLALGVDGAGDVTATHIEWEVERAVPNTSSPLLVGDELYMVSDVGVISCLDAESGEVHWQQRVVGNYAASPVYGAGRIYFLSEEGVATVIAPGKEYIQLATNSLDGYTLASMAVSAGSILIRSQSHLYRVSTP